MKARVLQWRLRPQFKAGSRVDLIWTDYAQKGKDRFSTQEDVDRKNAESEAALALGAEWTGRLFEYRLKPEK